MGAITQELVSAVGDERAADARRTRPHLDVFSAPSDVDRQGVSVAGADRQQIPTPAGWWRQKHP